MSTEDGRQPLMMITTLNQLEEMRDTHGLVQLTFGPHGWVAKVRAMESRHHLDLGEAVQELYILVSEVGSQPRAIGGS